MSQVLVVSLRRRPDLAGVGRVGYRFCGIDGDVLLMVLNIGHPRQSTQTPVSATDPPRRSE